MAVLLSTVPLQATPLLVSSGKSGRDHSTRRPRVATRVVSTESTKSCTDTGDRGGGALSEGVLFHANNKICGLMYPVFSTRLLG